MTIIDEVLHNNEAYAKGFNQGNLAMPPAKKLAVVACMDARLVVSKILGTAEGDGRRGLRSGALLCFSGARGERPSADSESEIASLDSEADPCARLCLRR